MGLTTKNMTINERRGRARRIYDLGNGFSLSVVKLSEWGSDPIAKWEIAVLNGAGVTFQTPLTDDVERFDTDAEANDFISRAFHWGKTGEWQTTYP
jgi:hypothetical protein